jgi:hypothetical protein
MNGSLVIPGQPDENVLAWINSYRRTKGVGGAEAALAYARKLYASQPKMQDFIDQDRGEDWRPAVDAWNKNLTAFQRKIYDHQVEKWQEKRREGWRLEYAAKQAVKFGRRVVPRRRNLTDDERKAAARKHQADFKARKTPEERRQYERDKKARYRAGLKENSST